VNRLSVLCSDVVLEARPMASRRLEANFYGLGLGLGLGTYGFGLGLGTCGLIGLGLEGPGLGFESCINNFLPSPSNSRPDYYYVLK